MFTFGLDPFVYASIRGAGLMMALRAGCKSSSEDRAGHWRFLRLFVGLGMSCTWVIHRTGLIVATSQPAVGLGPTANQGVGLYPSLHVRFARLVSCVPCLEQETGDYSQANNAYFC